MKKIAKGIVEGDVFEYDGETQVAISDFHEGFVWVTRVGSYHGARIAPGYTNTALMEIDGDAVVNYEHIPTIAECEEAEDRWEDSFYGGWR